MLFALITADDVQVLQAMLPSHSLGSAVVDPFSKRNKPPRSNAQTKLEAIISDIWSLVNRNPPLYHEAVVDYTDADTHTQLTNVILKGMPSALMDRARQTIQGHGKDRQQGRIEDRQRAHCSPRRQRLILCLGSSKVYLTQPQTLPL